MESSLTLESHPASSSMPLHDAEAVDFEEEDRAKITEERGPMPQRFIAEESATSSEQSPIRILAYGDSITAGYYAGGRRFAPYGKFMVEELSKHIPAEVWVCGLSSCTAEELSEDANREEIIDGVNRRGMGLQKILDIHGPFDLAIIMLGTNDIAEPDSPSRIFTAIKDLHSRCHKLRTCTMALAIPHTKFLFEDPDEEYVECWRTVNGFLRDWASGEEADGWVSAFVDTGEVAPWTDSEPGNLFCDDLHLSPAGEERLGSSLVPIILEHLRSYPRAGPGVMPARDPGDGS